MPRIVVSIAGACLILEEGGGVSRAEGVWREGGGSGGTLGGVEVRAAG